MKRGHAYGGACQCGGVIASNEYTITTLRGCKKKPCSQYAASNHRNRHMPWLWPHRAAVAKSMTPAQAARVAWFNAMRGRDAAGRPLPTWSQLSAAERQAWKDAADAAVLAWREREKERAA